ncbi:DUF3631 domain-containing protein [Williamsia sp. DF01-3]|uniref:DUF3631 domain-containing protein n=1 Tax=Williamsia sp. DF01-3 TaxID=2934157 RepID=UPI0035B20D6E
MEALAATVPSAIGVVDRAADVWEPLGTVADVAGSGWGQRVRREASALTRLHHEDN